MSAEKILSIPVLCGQCATVVAREVSTQRWSRTHTCGRHVRVGVTVPLSTTISAHEGPCVSVSPKTTLAYARISRQGAGAPRGGFRPGCAPRVRRRFSRPRRGVRRLPLLGLGFRGAVPCTPRGSHARRAGGAKESRGPIKIRGSGDTTPAPAAGLGEIARLPLIRDSVRFTESGLAGAESGVASRP